MVVIGSLPAMIKRDFPQPSSGHVSDLSKHRTTSTSKTIVQNGTAENLNFSMTSVLNQRPTEILENGLSESKLNVRYNKRRAPAPPIANGHVPNGMGNGEITTILEVDSDIDLAENKLNNRYLSQNGDAKTYTDTNGDLSQSKLNTRYVKSSKVNARTKSGVADQISRKDKVFDRRSVASDLSDGQSAWSNWVDDVFNDALFNEVNDDVSDGRSLEQRIKGGGKGIPGITTQQVG